MTRSTAKPSQSLAQLLREGRLQMGLSLREVERRTAEFGLPIPYSTINRIEQGQLDPDTTRLHLLLKLYRLPFHMAGDLIDLEVLAAKPPKGKDSEELYQEGVEHLKRGNTRKGLAHLFALREQLADRLEDRVHRQKALISFAIAAGSLGKYRMSLQIVQDLLLESVEPSLLLSVLVQAGATWNSLGSPEAGLAFFERAEKHVEAGDHARRAWVAHGKAVALKNQKRFDEAAAALELARQSYRKAGDAHGEGTSLGALARLRLASGDKPGALRAARAGKEHAERHGFDRLRILALLTEGNILVLTGETDSGLVALNKAAGDALASGDQAAQFYAHYYLWKAYQNLGDPERAEVELNAARYFVRFIDEVTEEVSEVRGGME